MELKDIICFNLPEQYIKKFPAKLIMIIMLEICSAHIVHNGGAYEFWVFIQFTHVVLRYTA